jgi:gluconate 2-dehydrogenase gamma chain
MADKETQPRRRFLQQALAIVPVSTLAAGGVTITQVAHAADADGSTTKAYEPTYFTPPEWAFIKAAVDHLIPADQYGPGAIAAGVPEFIDRQMQTPYGMGKLWYMQGPFLPEVDATYGYQMSLAPRDIYRHGIDACNAWCQKQHNKAFAELDEATQTQILKDMQAGKIELDAVPAKTLFEFLLTNTKEGFLSDPIYGGNKHMVGWKMVGFTGARGDFADLSAEYNVKYPYGPVSISGEKA